MPSTAVSASSGLLQFIRYAFMPNHLGYCGGNENEVLLEHAADNRPDERLAPLLAKFTGAVPYLKTIAAANGIRDPFDPRVVEAYWIGNELLAEVEAGDLYRSLEERFGSQLTGKLREQVLRKPPQGAKPYHLFHVIDVYRHLESEEVGMAAMESCRISWGQVRAAGPERPLKAGDTGSNDLMVDRRPLVMVEGKLSLGEPRAEPVKRAVLGKGFVDDVAVGDWITIHWGWACEVIDQRRLANLEAFTRRHLVIANQTI